MVHFSKIIPSFVFLVLYVFPNTGTYEFFFSRIIQFLAILFRPEIDKLLGLSWDIILSMVIFYLHTPHISHQTFCLFKNPSFFLISWFLSLSIQFLSFCFKNLLRFRFTMTTSLNHLEFYIFKMNWLHICKWKLVFIICHWQTNGNIIHSLDGNRTKIFGFKIRKLNQGCS